MFLLCPIYNRQTGRLFCLSLVLQVVSEPVGQGKVRKEVQSVTADAAPDALTTQRAQQSWCGYEKETINTLCKMVIELILYH